MSRCERTLPLPDESAVAALAVRLAPVLPAPFVVYLRGDLGAGKTTFARALIRALGHSGSVKSPTYGLLETYPLAGRTVLHLDLYRIDRAEDLEYLAIADLFGADGLLLVEWPERGAGWLPAADLELRFDYQDDGRRLGLRASSAAGRTVLDRLFAAA